MTLKQLQARRDLLQNIASQRPGIDRDLADVERRLAEHTAAIPPLTAERDALAEKSKAVDAARAELPGLGEWHVLFLQLDVTAAATGAGDKLNVYVQTTIDGTNYIDIAHFTEVLANGSAKRYFAKLIWDAALTEFENATALGAAAQRAICGDAYRVRWAVTDSGSHVQSFTFSVTANAL